MGIYSCHLNDPAESGQRRREIILLHDLIQHLRPDLGLTPSQFVTAVWIFSTVFAVLFLMIFMQGRFFKNPSEVDERTER